MSYFLPYQQNWLADKSRIKVWEKSRRIGATYVQAYEDVEDCIFGKTKEVWFSSADETAAREYILYCEKWARVFELANKNLGSGGLVDDVKTFSLKFTNGSRINALSSSPTQFRSKGGKIILDEFAHHRDAGELWRAASPSGTVWQFPIRILSTHDDTECLFNRFVQGCKKGELDWSLHTVTLNDAIEQGLVKRISEVSGKELTVEQFIDDTRKTCPDEVTWLREYCCEPRVNVELLAVKNFTDQNVSKVNYTQYIQVGSDKREVDLHISCDFNWSPNCWVLGHVDRNDLDFYFFKEYCFDMSTENLIQKVLDEYPHPSRIVVNGDASGYQRRSSSTSTDYNIIRNELIRRGYRPEGEYCKAGKRFKMEVRKHNGNKNLRFQSFNSRVRDIDGNPHVFIDPQGCPNLIYACENLQLLAGTSDYKRPTQKQMEANPKLKFMEHIKDAADYCVNFNAPIERLQPPPIQRRKTLIERWNSNEWI